MSQPTMTGERPALDAGQAAFDSVATASDRRTQRAYERAERWSHRAQLRSTSQARYVPRGVVFGLFLVLVGATSLVGVAQPWLAAVTWPLACITIGGLVIVAAFRR